MSAVLSLENLVSWLIQFTVIVVAGTLLPAIFRIRHPKSQLVYYHGILLLGLAFPFIQPWQHSLVIVSSVAASPGPVAAGFGIPWTGVVLAIFGVGVVAKLCWLVAGFWQLRRYRNSAIPIYPIPVSIREARMRTGADALFCVSRDVRGPATLGFIDPVVLLPPSFLALDEDAQRSIACHELLHVRRNDWLVTVMEEVAGALLWFHPAVWWLLAEAKLTREQLVDAEVVRMTATAPYIQALLSMAVVSKGRLAGPAAFFFTEGHLVHRMRSLLANSRRSLAGLCASYVSAACVLGLAGWTVLVLFPLNGEDQIVTTFAELRPARVDRVEGKRAALEAAATQMQFDVRVPAPAGATHDVNYFMNVEIPDPSRESELAMMPLPPPPPPPPRLPFRIFEGVRVLRPGQVATPEEVQSFFASFPERPLIQVTQGEDGTVQKITITGRPANATMFIPFGAHNLDGLAGPDAAADTTNGLH